MYGRLQSSEVTILVKALPQPSKKFGETVCCAGLTDSGEWKRLFPIRFRHLSGSQSFQRWDRVNFSYHLPRQDTRRESCHVFEDTISIGKPLSKHERVRLLNRVIVESAKKAEEAGQSLALIRPKNTVFKFKKKTASQLESEREAYGRAASQGSFLDQELAAMEPSPFRFGFAFEDGSGKHAYQCADWEIHAMYFSGRLRIGEAKTLAWMEHTFNETYPTAGMAFALGNMAKRPQTWQLLGVIRLDEDTQGDLFSRT